MSLAPIVEAYRLALQPIAPFTWIGLGVSTLDVVAATRLCLVMRQIRVAAYNDHIAKRSAKEVEVPSFVKDLITTLVVVYGGEAVACPLLGLPPSFMVSATYPLLYSGIQTIVEFLPWLPTFSLETELPLSLLDAFSRSFLLCSLIPPPVTTHALPTLSTSPWTLLLTSLITANGGFFIVNLFSMLHPGGWTLATPTELRSYGWSTVDLWCAPLVTGLFALFTHAQPFWADMHALILAAVGGQTQIFISGEKTAPVVPPVDPEVVRAGCAVFLAMLFVTRATKNFGGEWWSRRGLRKEKKLVPRSKVDGRKYSGPKIKAQ